MMMHVLHDQSSLHIHLFCDTKRVIFLGWLLKNLNHIKSNKKRIWIYEHRSQKKKIIIIREILQFFYIKKNLWEIKWELKMLRWELEKV